MLDQYEWHDPSDVVTANDSRDEIIAYGVPKKVEPPALQTFIQPEAIQPQAIVKPKDDDPLPKPNHQTLVGREDECLACDWLDLRTKILAQEEADRAKD